MTLRDMMRQAHYVPETKRCGELFAELQGKAPAYGHCSRRYGGTAGLITIEDILESIVGNIQDEYDQEPEEVSVIDEKTFTIDGTADIEEVEELIGVTIPEGDYDTLGGYIISVLGFLPPEW